ncbi:MAG: hypothetical protein AAFY56_10465 [Pseudomonadota bacterium]
MFTVSEYLGFTAISLGYVALFLSPIIYAAIIANFPTKVSKRMRFSLVCGALSYGSIMLAEAALLPVHMVAMFLSPSWHSSGYESLANAFYVASEYSFVLSGVAGIIVAIWLPLHIRKTVWHKVYPTQH